MQTNQKFKKYENNMERIREDSAEKKNFSKYANAQSNSNVLNNWRIPNKNVEKNGKSIPNFQIYGTSSKKIRKKIECADKPNFQNKMNDGGTSNISGNKFNNSATSLKLDRAVNEMFPEELSILNEEPLNTTNPLKAIFGYVPMDEAKLCKFSVNGECFKKSKCHLNHEEKLLEGWTKDKVGVVISNCNEPTHPAFGTSFQVIPTFIEESGYKFYGQIISHDLLKFYELMSNINLPEELEKFETYSENLIPTLAELVLAKYSDGLFYRAQIMDYDEITNSVFVFFVDYGNSESVAVENIRKWKSQLDIVSFQALHFTLDGIKCASTKETELRMFVEKNILNKFWHASVVNHFDSVYIKLFNDDCDISNEILKLGLGEVNESVNLLNKFDKPIKIPG
ncbi:RING finger protein 17-like [Condylostylus longicornis]|uniref:RING finger protein 17-like n=1 Tax=Condylostylus longicornis TaxID=2530218 RepID=UPI00244DAD09|nr:RING finger protein 17-like [Condylostylus longicornis]